MVRNRTALCIACFDQIAPYTINGISVTVCFFLSSVNLSLSQFSLQWLQLYCGRCPVVPSTVFCSFRGATVAVSCHVTFNFTRPGAMSPTVVQLSRTIKKQASATLSPEELSLTQKLALIEHKR